MRAYEKLEIEKRIEKLEKMRDELKKKGETKMKNFYFVDDETGEDFIVEAETLAKARYIAGDYFNEVHFLREVDDEDAEMLGVDTY